MPTPLWQYYSSTCTFVQASLKRRTLWHEPRSWFFLMSGGSMGGLVHTLACYSMMTLISMECMEVWALCIVKHLYEGIMRSEASIWNSLTWTLELILPDVRRQYGGTSAHTCMLFHSVYCLWNVWKYGHCFLWHMNIKFKTEEELMDGWFGLFNGISVTSGQWKGENKGLYDMKHLF